MIVLEPRAQVGHGAVNKVQALYSIPCAVIKLAIFYRLVNIPELWVSSWLNGDIKDKIKMNKMPFLIVSY